MSEYPIQNDEKLPFVRQIHDYHKYSILGSTWMVTRLGFQNFNINKFEKIYLQLLNEQSILRTVFVKKNDGLIIRKTIPTVSPLLDFKIFNIDSYAEIDCFFEAFHNEYRYSELSDVLTKLFIFNHSKISYVFLCINHIICDRHCLEKIKDELIKKYTRPEYSFEFYDFDEYCSMRNTSLFKKFNSDYSFFEKKINHELKNKIDYSNEHLWLKNICNLEYNYQLQNKKPLTLDSLVRLDVKKLSHVNIKSLVLCALLRTQKDFFGTNNHVGFLFRDSLFPKFNNCIGQLTAEGTVFDHPEESSSDVNYLKINKELISSYRRPIFNYSMYDLNESCLEENKIPIFLNFNKIRIDYIENYSYSLKNSFYESPTVKGYIEPNIILYENGYLLCRWIFDENRIYKKDMIKFKDLFEDNINYDYGHSISAITEC